MDPTLTDLDPLGRVEGSTTVLTHPTYGEFRLESVQSRPPSYVASRWPERDTSVGTLGEFHIEPRRVPDPVGHRAPGCHDVRGG